MATKTTKKVKTGFCGNGQCEGTKPVSRTGKPMKICTFWDTCACSCHELITKMYEMAGLPREEPEQSPEYVAIANQNHLEMQLMLDSLARYSSLSGPLSSSGAPDAHPTDEGTVATPSVAGTGTASQQAKPRFTPTPTGRRARGQLEYDVLKVCDNFSHDVYEWQYCTPKLVAEEIGKMNATEPPSTGAINAVWDRWERIGFAVQDKKPSRFVMFKDGLDGSIATLEMLKARRKREKKRGEAEARRGTLRPRGR